MLTPRTNSSAFPLLMGITHPTPVKEADDSQIIYDEQKQVTYETMGIMGWLSKTHRTIGTRCYRTSSTKKGSGLVTDQKNEIDDTKGKED